MSRAFVREDDQAPEQLPERPVSLHPNFVTERGRDLIEGEVTKLRAEMSAAQQSDDRTALPRITRDLHYWEQRRATAQVKRPPADAETVQFGATVTIQRSDGRRQTWQIVGEDEADPAQGTLSYVSPVAQALTGRRVGDVVQAGNSEAEIVAIE